jgi:16S rRNA (cytosine1402-N4)-methyltransferase
MTYHKPVLLQQSIDGLQVKPTGTYVDTTFGGGGHSSLILKQLKSGGKLFGFDQDSEALKNNLSNQNFKLIHSNFRYIKQFLRFEGVKEVDGILADLGVSSHQFDSADRGFSIRKKGDLDMRMSADLTISAKDIVNKYSQEDLARVLFQYGELKNSRKIAYTICSDRIESKIETTEDLIKSIHRLFPKNNLNKFLARVFQAIRIEVNDEVNSLKEMLNSSVDLLSAGGRIVIISYHSLEDRIVKNLFKKGNFDGIVEKDIYGNSKKIFKEINNRIITPGANEILKNSRSRSAKLRIAEKI